jgi:hypothetical protein
MINDLEEDSNKKMNGDESDQGTLYTSMEISQ